VVFTTRLPLSLLHILLGRAFVSLLVACCVSPRRFVRLCLMPRSMPPPILDFSSSFVCRFADLLSAGLSFCRAERRMFFATPSLFDAFRLLDTSASDAACSALCRRPFGSVCGSYRQSRLPATIDFAVA